MPERKLTLGWRRLKPKQNRLPAMAWCLWRRNEDHYVFMGWHDYTHCFRIDDPSKPMCRVEEARWCPVPCYEIPVVN